MALTKIPGELFDADDLDLSDVGTIALDAIKGEADTDTSITFSGSNVITIKANNANQVTFIDGAIVPSTDNDIDLGTSSVEFKDAFFDGTVTSDAFAGPLTGNVTGDVSGSSGSTTGNSATATALQNARTIGGTSFDGTANIAVALAATATALATPRTIHGVSFDGTANIDLSEVIADTVGAMVSSNTETNITVSYEDSDNTLDFVIGTLNQNTTGTAANLSGTPNITVGTIGSGNITTTGYLAGPASFVIDPATVGDDTGVVVIAGGLQVDGTTTTINSTTLTVDDLNVVLASGAANSAAANGAGITVDGASATILYTHATTSWDLNKPVNVTGAFSASGAITGTLATAAQTNITSLGTLTSLNVGTVTSTGNLSMATDNATIYIGADLDLRFTHSGSLGSIINNTGNLLLDSASNITLDADGGQIELKDGGTLFGHLEKSGNNFEIHSKVQDGDILFRGFDASSQITALTLDMSDAGAATFNAGVTATTGAFSAAGNGNSPILHVIDTADTEVAWFEGRRAADTGAFIAIRHNPSSPAESNRSGIKFQADDSAGNRVHYAKITQYISDNTDGTEDGDLAFNQIINGTDTETMRLKAGNVGIGTASPTYPLDVVANSSAQAIKVRGRSADNIGEINLVNNAGDSTYSQIQSLSTELKVKAIANIPMSFHTNNTARVTISNSGNISTHPPAGNHFVINEDGVDSDFRVESDGNAHMLFVDGGNNRVGIDQASPDTKLHIGNGASTYVRIENASSGDVSSGYQIYRGASTVGASLYDNPADNATSLLVAGKFNLNAGGSGTDLYVAAGGNVGIPNTLNIGSNAIDGTTAISGELLRLDSAGDNTPLISMVQSNSRLAWIGAYYSNQANSYLSFAPPEGSTDRTAVDMFHLHGDGLIQIRNTAGTLKTFLSNYTGSGTNSGFVLGGVDATASSGTGNMHSIHFIQSGKITFGDWTDSNPIGICEGGWNEEGTDRDYLTIAGRNRIIFKGNTDAEKMRLDTGGTLSIGTTAAGTNAKLNVAGGINYTHSPASAAGLNVVAQFSFNNTDTANACGDVYYKMFMLNFYHNNGHSQCLFLANGGGGVGYRFTTIEPGSNTVRNGIVDFSFTTIGSSPNTFRVQISNGGGALTVSRTSGTGSFQISVQPLTGG